MGEIIDGKKIAKELNKKTLKELGEPGGRRPGLAIILIGDQDDSRLYVSLKEKEAKKIGIDTHVYKCEADTDQSQVLEMIKHLNGDDEIDGILVQLPLPKKFNTDKIIQAIDPSKDVDRFHPKNLAVLFATCIHGHTVGLKPQSAGAMLLPPVHGTILAMLKSINLSLKNKRICIIANSEIFGKSMAKVLDCRGGTAIVIGPDDRNLIEETFKADVLITAVGRPKFIDEKMVKKGVVVLDVGITKKGKHVRGDVDFEKVKEKASHITPVPGGVGPGTVSMLLLNTAKLAKARIVE